MLTTQVLAIVGALCSIRAIEIKPEGSQTLVDNKLLIELLKKIEAKDEAIDELRKNQERQGTIIDTLRNDNDKMKF
ncbi:hypothetical protein DPMN_136362 [Dreissena polymorpha]|uniref:Uncharacterized protein n=1 Tax=Dreissena polymorpha TaxID=45954 RepID=A0A9D4FZL5_DREPO|nr:hypothetical protein DPMN_136362 [Dreissena polymorpha]